MNNETWLTAFLPAVCRLRQLSLIFVSLSADAKVMTVLNAYTSKSTGTLAVVSEIL